VATNPRRQDPPDEQTLLVAQLRAFLVNGESFDLVPIEHEQDVKSEVESLLRSWAESGYLIHGRFIYPWHQIQRVEVLQVLETDRYDERSAIDRARAEQEFWRTRRKSAKPGKEKTPDTGPRPH
jgi:hypothetical protein